MAEVSELLPVGDPESPYDNLAAMHIAVLTTIRSMVEAADPEVALGGDLVRTGGIMSWPSRGPEINRRAGDVQRAGRLIAGLSQLLAEVSAAEIANQDVPEAMAVPSTAAALLLEIPAADTAPVLIS